MFQTLKQIFFQINYTAIALIVAVSIFSLSIWLPNIKLIISFFSSHAIIFEKFYFLFNLFNSIITNFTVVSAIVMIIISLLFGINIALLIYLIHFRQGRKAGQVSSVLSFGGLFGGLFGIGCATCGTFVLSSFLGMLGFAGTLHFLPFAGEEFGILGIILLIYAITVTVKKINQTQVCDI